MTAHLKHSRITKALTDRLGGAASFPEAEENLNKVRVAIVLAPDQARTAAGQAAALTAIATSCKCFGSATLVAEPESKLVKALPVGDTVGVAATSLGAVVAASVSCDATHVVRIGSSVAPDGETFVRCWWNGWIAGIVPAWDDRPLGASGNPLAGVFSGALAVREIFATVLRYPRSGSRQSIVSLWESGIDPEIAAPGPAQVYIPSRLWFVGLGHVGQGILWAFGLLPVCGIEAVLQDDQKAGEENEATGLLTTGDDLNRRKARIAADWLDKIGWSTRAIERRHYGDIPLLAGDPAIVITSLDEPDARIQITNTGFEYLIDAGIGHGPIDFEALQIRVLKKGVDAVTFWSSPDRSRSVDQLMEREPYRALEGVSDRCGSLTLANASIAVPFVGAAVGALTVAQAIRLASMQSTIQMMQMQLGAPAMAVVGATNTPPEESRGSIEIDLA
jgi:hypothetical protein